MRVFDDELVEIISEEISTNMATMSIIDPKKGALGPLRAMKLLRFWFHDIQNDRDTIFVIVAHDTLIGVRTVRSNYAISFG